MYLCNGISPVPDNKIIKSVEGSFVDILPICQVLIVYRSMSLDSDQTGSANISP